MTGSLCRKAGGSALCYKHGGSALVFKGVLPGDVVVVVTSSRAQVGPINSCGNIHDVEVTLGNSSGLGSVSVSVAPVTASLSGSTESVGCAYPEENPPVTLKVVAVQASTGKSYTTTKSIANVATGSFSVSLSWSGKTLSGVS